MFFETRKKKTKKEVEIINNRESPHTKSQDTLE